MPNFPRLHQFMKNRFFSLMKHGHGRLGIHIIMVPLHIHMYFLDPHVGKCKQIYPKKTAINSNILEVKAWQVNTL